MAVQIRDEIEDFLSRCDDLKNCMFIMATTKIKDLLKSIANSRELCRLFSELTKNFDYNEAKNNCFVCFTDGVTKRNSLVLPSEPDFRLAFTFCLLVDIDRENIDFEELLTRYFYVDGSYYSSYQLFVDEIIINMASIIRQCYSAVLTTGNNKKMANDSYRLSDGISEVRGETVSAQQDENVSKLKFISLEISAEKNFLSNLEISQEDRESGIIILNEVENALKRSDFNVVSALLCGYNYFVQYYNCVSEEFKRIVKLIEDYKSVI